MAKAPLPQRYLNKPGGQWRPVRMYNIAVMLYAALQANEDNEIGWGDTLESVDTMLYRMGYVQLVEPRIIEALLWCCNMLNEKGKFKDVKGRTFEKFVEELLNGKGDFDPVYGTVTWHNTRKHDV